MIKAGVTFSFVPAAMGYHHIQETTDLKRIFQRARQEGWVDVTMAQHHPEIKAGLLLAQLKHTRWRYRFILHLLVFIGSFISDKLMTQLQRVLYPLERVALRTYWKKLYGCLHLYWYWRGVADRLKTWQALVNFVREEPSPLNPSESYLDLDLRQGLAAAEAQLDRERPASLWIHYGQQWVGFFPSQPGTERWRGEHLRPLLADKLASPFLEALALEGVIQGSAQLDRHKLYQSLKATAPWFGPTRLEQMWYEQYSQWNQFERRANGNEEQLDQNWELVKKQEDEMIWLAQKLNELGWRNRLYLTLYRWHQPFYEWYSRRGWNWLTFFRERIKQTLFSQDKA